MQFKDKILILRLNRLGHIPPAQYATEILQEKGFPVLVVEFGDLREARGEITEPIPKLRLQSAWARWLPRQLRAVAIFGVTLLSLSARLVFFGRPKLFVAHGLQEQTLIFMLHLVFRIPYLAHVHEIYDDKDLRGLNRFFLFLERWSLRKASFLIFPEKSRSEIYKERYKLTNSIFVIYNCPRRRTPGPKLDLKSQFGCALDEYFMIYLGGIAKENMLEELVLALPEIPRLHLIVAGWGSQEYSQHLTDLARQHHLSKRVHFVGQLNQQEKWYYLDSCDLCYCVYLPSLLRLQFAATASNKVMEAISSGLAVVSLDRPDFRAVIEALDVGICLPGVQPQMMAKAINDLLKNSEALARKSQNGLRHHQEWLHYEHQFSPLLEAFSEEGYRLHTPDEVSHQGEIGNEA